VPTAKSRGRPKQAPPNEVLAYLDERDVPFLTAEAIEQRFNCSDQTARNRLRELAEENELTSVNLGPGKPTLWFRPDYESATTVVDALRENFDLAEIDTDHMGAFAEEPYCILPKEENEAFVVVPRFVPFHVGWLDRQTDSYNVFVVNKYVDWIDELPDEIRGQVGIDEKYHEATVADGMLHVDPADRDEAWDEFSRDAIPGDETLREMEWDRLRSLASRLGVLEQGMGREDVERALSAERDDTTIPLKPSREFDVIAQLIEDGNLPFAPQPIDEDALRGEPENVELREYQERAWERFVETGMIGVYWPPGAGKTFLSLYAGERMKGDKLVVVPNNTLKEQWQNRVDEFAERSWEWEVQTYQYLTHGNNIDEYQRNGPALTIFDECHHLPANTFAKLATIDTDSRIGLSASPYREDDRTEYIFALTGFPVGLNWQELVALGVVETPPARVLLYGTQHQKRKGVPELVNERTGKILILCDSIDRGKELADDLGVPFVHGETRDRMEKFTENRVVIGSRVADEGLSLSELDVVIEYDFFGASRRQEAQRYGRVLHGESHGEYLILMTDEEYESHSNRLMALEEQGIGVRFERRS
jgi:DNA excision repair protein ERCC-3